VCGVSGGKASPEVRRKASHDYYMRNRDAIRAKRNADARANPRKKDLTTEQERARARLRYAVWTGKVVKPTRCDDCGATGQINGHHHDYSKPLDVQWLCAACHGRAHAK
jgi:DnaJ-class molecular chaperone